MSDKKSVFVIDDDMSILRTFSRVLQKSDYEVDTAQTGREAIEKLGKRSYDVVLIDIRLPDMEGTDLLNAQREKMSKTVKILITGLSLMDQVANTAELDADCILTKPIKPEDLLAVIEEKLKNKKSEELG